MLCPLCDTPLESRADKYYFICSTCGAYVRDKKYHVTNEREKQRYLEHNNDIHDEAYQNFTSPITNTILQKFTAGHSGLDYGCGTSPVITKNLRENGYNVKLYDPYFYPDKDNLENNYDYIFSCEVFEHFNDPKSEINKLISILKPEGYLIIMTHLYNEKIPFAKWYYRNDDTHVFIYTLKTIKYIEKTFDLRVEKVDKKLIIFKHSAASTSSI
ncbi:MAG: class I SAM-dependent methyltransferase [Bacteroidales bacterium]|nr:class I SAM-dependent methyltransferase [Bacteroidales bacterium]MCF8327106.1 class I SAM-dependent methyltransferase [Bacteroidales bacterium]